MTDRALGDLSDHRQAPVLLVEDDEDLREIIAEVLEDCGHGVVTAENGKQALQRLQSDGIRPRVILLDLMMPVMDGWGFREAQQRDASLMSIPVVVLTAHANAEEAAGRMGAAGWLKKPVELADLLRVIPAGN